jgi:hypothetical protein
VFQHHTLSVTCLNFSTPLMSGIVVSISYLISKNVKFVNAFFRNLAITIWRSNMPRLSQLCTTSVKRKALAMQRGTKLLLLLRCNMSDDRVNNNALDKQDNEVREYSPLRKKP